MTMKQTTPTTKAEDKIMTREQKIQNIIKGTEMAVESLKMSGELTTERYIAIMECQNSAIAAVNAEA